MSEELEVTTPNSNSTSPPEHVSTDHGLGPTPILFIFFCCALGGKMALVKPTVYASWH